LFSFFFCYKTRLCFDCIKYRSPFLRQSLGLKCFWVKRRKVSTVKKQKCGIYDVLKKNWKWK
jgi:hypothetical protein